jgi:hypothetical protein
LERCGREGQRNTDHGVFNFAPIAVVLPFVSDRLVAALGCAGLVDHTDGIGIGLFFDNHLAASTKHLVVVPLDRF